jgi:hypothetical protein
MACHPREIFLGDGKLTWIHLFRVEQFELHVTKPTPEDVFELTGGKVDLSERSKIPPRPES